MEARAFIFGPALAYRLNAGFVPVRKPGKLPAATQKYNYALEYGTNTLEIHVDAIQKANVSLSWTIYSPQGGRRKPPQSWPSRWVQISPDWDSSSNWTF